MILRSFLYFPNFESSIETAAHVRSCTHTMADIVSDEAITVLDYEHCAGSSSFA